MLNEYMSKSTSFNLHALVPSTDLLIISSATQLFLDGGDLTSYDQVSIRQETLEIAINS